MNLADLMCLTICEGEGEYVCCNEKSVVILCY